MTVSSLEEMIPTGILNLLRRVNLLIIYLTRMIFWFFILSLNQNIMIYWKE